MSNIPKTRRKRNPTIELLTTAALALALVSWLATANGLSRYVFTGKAYWQAVIISMAIQGALFALSIKGPTLILSNGRGNRAYRVFRVIFVFFIWIVAMVASFTFSYVYISSYVYPNTLLMQDAQGILSADSLSKCYELRAINDGALEGRQEDMDAYITYLAASGESAGSLTGESDEELLGIIQSLGDFDDTELICNLLGQMVDGSITSDYREVLADSINALLEATAEVRNNRLEDLDNLRSNYNSNATRLASFRNTNDETYLDLLKKQDDLDSQMKVLNAEIASLEKEKSILSQASTAVQLSERSLESTLDTKVKELRELMNEIDIHADTEAILKCAGEIYDTLIENNVSSGDSRLAKYPEFKTSVKNFAALTAVSSAINAEINALTDTNNSVSNIPYSISEADGIDATWSAYWSQRLTAIQDIIERMIEGGAFTAVGEDEITITTATEMIKQLTAYRRMYLSDLNDFERATSLLSKDHEYKTLLYFSGGFAIFLDFFAFLIGWLIYFITRDSTKKEKREAK